MTASPERSGAGLRGPRLQTSLSAFEKLYETHGPRMKSLAYNILGNVSDAEDAVQEAFLRACRGSSSFRGGATLWTWICRILINTCYDIGRKRAVRRDDRGLDRDCADPVAPRAADHPLRLTLETAVADLSPRLREVFLLFEVEGCTHREIAEILDIAEGTSKAALFEAKCQLRAALRTRPLAGDRS